MGYVVMSEEAEVTVEAGDQKIYVGMEEEGKAMREAGHLKGHVGLEEEEGKHKGREGAQEEAPEGWPPRSMTRGMRHKHFRRQTSPSLGCRNED